MPPDRMTSEEMLALIKINAEWIARETHVSMSDAADYSLRGDIIPRLNRMLELATALIDVMPAARRGERIYAA